MMGGLSYIVSKMARLCFWVTHSPHYAFDFQKYWLPIPLFHYAFTSPHGIINLKMNAVYYIRKTHNLIGSGTLKRYDLI